MMLSQQITKKPRNHACDQCPKSFISNGDLKRHINSVHEKLKPFACE